MEMMNTVTENTRVIDGIYKNILENFNPMSRQMIVSGKAYLKSLHGVSTAFSQYLDNLVRLSGQAQQSSLGSSGDIGNCLKEITDVFKEINAQQLNTLKAFYVDFIVPLESNLEKDTRVIQNEQKKFFIVHKQRTESYVKAVSNVKKMRKRSKKNPAMSANHVDKEIKMMQNLEDEKAKLESFLENSVREGLTEERRRYGFVLERQVSLAKHYLSFYTNGSFMLQQKMDEWMDVAGSRETLPNTVQNVLPKRLMSIREEECIYCSPSEHPNDCAPQSQMRKAKSMDANEMLQCPPDAYSVLPVSAMSKAKSDMLLVKCGQMESSGSDADTASPAAASNGSHYAKAIYAYLSKDDSQLSFLDGDRIALIGDRNKGWQFGENLRTHKTGWFPVAFTVSECKDMKLLPSPAVPPPMPPPLPTSITGYRASGQSGIKGSVVPPRFPSKLLAPASDSLHSSNDSGFSNDAGNSGHRIPPPQPDVDYSDEEPQRHRLDIIKEEMKSGDKWLMDRYHMSESVRVGSNRRRSLSFNSVSRGNGPMMHRYNNENGFYRQNAPKEGPLKKFINRTKSLIWKEKQDNNIESISAAGSFSDLWGSHASLVDIPVYYKKEQIAGHESNSSSNDPCEKQVVNDSNNNNANKPPMPPPPPPPKALTHIPLPPVPPPLPYREEISRSKNSVYGNKVDSPDSTTARPTSTTSKDADSCIMISDHSRVQRCRTMDSDRSNNPPKIDRVKGDNNKGGSRNKQVQRMDSKDSSCYETPIVPKKGSVHSKNAKNANLSRKQRNERSQAKWEHLETNERSTSERDDDEGTEMNDNDHDHDFGDDSNSSIFVDQEVEEDAGSIPSEANHIIPSGEGRGDDCNCKRQEKVYGKTKSSSGPTKNIKGHSHSVRSTAVSMPGSGTKKNRMAVRMGGSVTTKNAVVPYVPKQIVLREDSNASSVNRRAIPRLKGSIRSEFHTVELIDIDSGKPLFDYGTHIHRRLYYPERNSKIDQKSERSGNLCGPWYDLWGADASVVQSK